MPENKPDFMGLVNEGTTCYMNSLLQTFFSIGHIRRVIYSISESSGIPLSI